MKQVEFMKERRMGGHQYAVGDRAIFEDHVAYSLAQNGVASIVWDDAVLAPKSITQEAGPKQT